MPADCFIDGLKSVNDNTTIPMYSKANKIYYLIHHKITGPKPRSLHTTTTQTIFKDPGDTELLKAWGDQE